MKLILFFMHIALIPDTLFAGRCSLSLVWKGQFKSPIGISVKTNIEVCFFLKCKKARSLSRRALTCMKDKLNTQPLHVLRIRLRTFYRGGCCIFFLLYDKIFHSVFLAGLQYFFEINTAFANDAG